MISALPMNNTVTFQEFIFTEIFTKVSIHQKPSVTYLFILTFYVHGNRFCKFMYILKVTHIKDLDCLEMTSENGWRDNQAHVTLKPHQ
jgi:hypothetical protein